MKPIIIVPPDALSPEDLKRLQDNDLCVVVAKDPALIKFLDPIPAQSSRTDIENAAIQLSRMLLKKGGTSWDENTRSTIARMYVDLLVSGTPLDPEPSQAETEKRYFITAKKEELERLAREEARAERAAAKKLKPKP